MNENNIVNEKAAISADMAIRLEKAFGGTANAWLQMQNNYDLARARRHEDQLKVQRTAPELALQSPFVGGVRRHRHTAAVRLVGKSCRTAARHEPGHRPKRNRREVY